MNKKQLHLSLTNSPEMKNNIKSPDKTIIQTHKTNRTDKTNKSLNSSLLHNINNNNLNKNNKENTHYPRKRTLISKYFKSQQSNITNKSLHNLSASKIQHHHNEQEIENITILEDYELIRDYIIGGIIGKGSFGEVKLATNRITGEQVAIKILEKSKLNTLELQNRSKLEIHTLKKLMHPNIAKLYRVIDSNEKIYLIMEYANNYELFNYINNKKKLSEYEASYIFSQLISAVEYMHILGVIHRDIKPENILLHLNSKSNNLSNHLNPNNHNTHLNFNLNPDIETFNPDFIEDYKLEYTEINFLSEKPNIKVVDYGLSSILNSPGQLFNTPCGSTSYTAPEIFEECYNGIKSDIWACGVVLYAMVVGEIPFDNPEDSTKIELIKNSELNIPKFISKECADLISNLLKKNPNERLLSSQIINHKFITKYKFSLNKGLDIMRIRTPIDSNVVDIVYEILNQKIDKKIIVNSVISNLYNEISTIYYLVVQKGIKNSNSNKMQFNIFNHHFEFDYNTKDSVSNMMSKKFIVHTSNPRNNIVKFISLMSTVSNNKEEEENNTCNNAGNNNVKADVNLYELNINQLYKKTTGNTYKNINSINNTNASVYSKKNSTMISFKMTSNNDINNNTRNNKNNLVNSKSGTINKTNRSKNNHINNINTKSEMEFKITDNNNQNNIKQKNKTKSIDTKNNTNNMNKNNTTNFKAVNINPNSSVLFSMQSTALNTKKNSNKNLNQHISINKINSNNDNENNTNTNTNKFIYKPVKLINKEKIYKRSSRCHSVNTSYRKRNSSNLKDNENNTNTNIPPISSSYNIKLINNNLNLSTNENKDNTKTPLHSNITNYLLNIKSTQDNPNKVVLNAKYKVKNKRGSFMCRSGILSGNKSNNTTSMNNSPNKTLNNHLNLNKSMINLNTNTNTNTNSFLDSNSTKKFSKKNSSCNFNYKLNYELFIKATNKLLEDNSNNTAEGAGTGTGTCIGIQKYQGIFDVFSSNTSNRKLKVIIEKLFTAFSIKKISIENVWTAYTYLCIKDEYLFKCELYELDDQYPDKYIVIFNLVSHQGNDKVDIDMKKRFRSNVLTNLMSGLTI